MIPWPKNQTSLKRCVMIIGVITFSIQCQLKYHFLNKKKLIYKKLNIILISGCFCTYSNSSSYEYIRDSLEKTLLSNLEQEDRLPFQGLPLVIVFAAEPNLPDKDLLTLREEGQNLADR